MITVGIDPGLNGAIGILRDGKFEYVFDMPTMLKGSGGTVKYEVDPAGIKRFLLGVILPGDYTEAFLERVSAMPGQGVASMFSMGDSFGVARAVLATCGFSTTIETPVKWKKHFSLTSDKEQSRALAIKMFPTAELHLKKHNDRAEALLMAYYLWEKKHA